MRVISILILFIALLGNAVYASSEPTSRPDERPTALIMGDWQTVAQATQQIIECDTCFRITQEAGGQIGCVWDHTARDLNDGIDLSYTMNFGDINNNGADGMTMVFSTIPDQCGQSGAGLGAVGLDNAIVFEFDTWSNGAAEDDPGLCQDHVGMWINDDISDMEFGPECIGSFPFDNLEDGDFHEIEFTWDPVSMDFSLSIDGDVELTGNFDFEGYLGNTEFFLGFTGSTGGAFNEQTVCPGLPIAPPEPPVFVLSDPDVCAGDQDVLYTVSAMGQDLVWTVPPGSSFTASDSSIFVDFGNQSGQICASTMTCEQSDPVCIDVTVHPLPDVMADDPPLVCEDEFFIDEIIINGLDGTEDIRYYETEQNAIDDINRFLSFRIIESQTIWIRVTSAQGCVSVISATVTFGNINGQYLPSPPAPLCAGDSMDLSDIQYFDDNGNVISSIEWYDTESDAELQINARSSIVSEPGIYWVRLESEAGCTDILFVEITEVGLPVIELQEDTLACNNPALIIGHDGDPFWSYVWTDSMDNVISMDDVAQVTEAGIYYVEIMDGNGCRSTDSVMIFQDSDVPSVSIAADTLTCLFAAGRFRLDTLIPGASYQWDGPDDFDSTRAEPIYIVGGDYDLTITAPNGCTAVSSIQVEVDTSVSETLYALPDTLSCRISETVLLADTIYSDQSYTWTGPDGYISTSGEPVVSAAGRYMLRIMASNGCRYDTSVVVEIDTMTPSLSLSVDTLRCEDDSLQISSISNANEWDWTGPGGYSSMEQEPYIFQAGVYFVTATGANGCMRLDSIEVIADQDIPQVIIEADTLTCFADIAGIRAVTDIDGYEYLWTWPDGFTSMAQNIFVVDSGVYHLRVSAPNGCLQEYEIFMESERDTPVIETSVGIIDCRTPFGEMSVSGDIDDLADIQWINLQGFMSDEAMTSSDESGRYYVSYTDPSNGCTAIDSVDLLVDTLHPVITLGRIDTLTCETDSVRLLAEVQPGDALLMWIGPAGFNTDELQPWASLPGEYRIIAALANGCDAQAILNVEADEDIPMVRLITDTISCSMPIAELTAEGASPDWEISWISENDVIRQGSTIETDEAGTYNVVVSDPSSGCDLETSVTVAADTLSPSLVISSDSLGCAATEVILITETGAQEIEYLWSGPNQYSSMEASPIASEAGIYRLIITDLSNGCSTTGEHELVSSGDAIQGVILEITDALCGDELGQIRVIDVIGGNPSYDFSIEGTDLQGSAGSFDSLVGGEYRLIIEDELGCMLIRDFSILETADISVDGPTEVNLDLGDSLEVIYSVSNLYETIRWSPSPSSCDTCLTFFFTDADQGLYTLEVVDSNGCTDDIQVIVKVSRPRFFVANVFTPSNEDGVNDRFFIQGPEDGNYVSDLQIYDRWGSLVFEHESAPINRPEYGWNGVIKTDLAQTAVYVYYYEIRVGDVVIQQGQGDLTLLR